MENKGINKRQGIFNEFSENFSKVMNNPHVEKINIDYYICPLCRNSFTEKDLDQALQNPLTIEDVPPKKLKGKPLLLTCKKCNNINGSVYDSELGKWFKAFCALEGNGDLEFKMKIDSSRPFNVKLTRDIEKQQININSNNKNPYAKQNVSNMHNNGKAEVNYIFDFGDDKKINDGLLRFSYLYAFYFFGYSYIFSAGGKYLNDYISFNKNTELKPLVISENLDNYEQGIYKISFPLNITSFLVVFTFGSEIKKNVGIIIPSPKIEHLNNFKSINRQKIGPLKFQKILKQEINNRPFVCYEVWN
ncbi:hypothetical protein O8E88_000472 [Flavobacterium psychrophilum]|uniref:hypothetical protein n=1 Tax=Flavobacterium psychrophilum TaxID=96345 RepID=UPI0004F6A49D|nr:hypothetical protein [Flavobacterium psychrophilum]AIN75178.1 hypothetical protein FPG3_07170 [Flavobacterium psychrophilum FPG3]EKT2068690.1 hypothetical protein [Flavobacterium psychrophilum]EKT2070792.1 hypothetical protein [Flavobacterium psychrophilum]EKT4490303.1 hypothetical protein [Flavobacterium psychrophilum]MBF2044999.1 hypothetical protein [Flavobacterium psychrophilum]